MRVEEIHYEHNTSVFLLCETISSSTSKNIYLFLQYASWDVIIQSKLVYSWQIHQN